jgi:membrane protease YdiL (CAAX protease family)
MAIFGPDFRAGVVESLYRPARPVKLGWSIGIFLSLVVVNQMLQVLFGLGLHAVTSADTADPQLMIRSVMIALLPAGLVTACLAWLFARIRGGRPMAVLALRFPALGIGGWLAILFVFLGALYLLIAVAIFFFSIDISSKGAVEDAMGALVNDRAYAIMAAGIALGAPLAEEMTFRGQIFAALSQTRLGYAGTSVITSLVWALIHVTEPLYAIALIFVMGLILSVLLIRFGSLWVTFVCHASWNGIYSLALFALPQT